MENSEFDYSKYLLLIAKRKRLFATVALLIMTGAVILSYLLPKKYEAASTLFIEKNVISELVKGIAVTPSMDEAIKGLTTDMTSRTLILKVVDDLDLNLGKQGDRGLEGRIRNIQQNIDIKQKGNEIFTISYVDPDPRLARDFVNTLVRRYIEQNISSKREESYDAIKFLGEQMNTFREKLDKTEDELNRYKLEKGAVIAIDEGKLFEEINQAQQKLYDIQLRRRHLEGLRTVTRKAGNPLQAKMVALQKQLEELRITYTDNYPEVVRVKGEIETLREQMKGKKQEEVMIDPQELDKVEAEIQALRMSEEGLKRHIATNQALLRNIPTAKAELEKLEVEKKNRRDIYDQLMARHGQSEVSKQMEVQDKTTTFRIVDPAILPIRPISPNRLRIMLMGILAGLAGAMGLLMVLDYFDDSVKSVETLKEIGLPVLAVIPKIRSAEAETRERASALRVYVSAGAYFVFLIAIMVLEVTGKSPVDRFIGKLQAML
ncbi:XrtA system polysaccharide chain length determinant [Geobacter sp.]|uniref:XrtA system polysaccharide chain length determinant n=1 Tax=Geobacter sp. TaxID=46610 RepID=UPI002631FF7D|nr:XrtA system polysaccharide chain length determinant [Geobacter sp.]